MPHADPVVLDEGRARAAFRELAAGPVRELPRAPRVSRAHAQLRDHYRPGGRDVGLQPVRLLPGGSGGDLSVQLRRRAARRARALPGLRRGHRRLAAVPRLPGRHRSRAAGHHRLPGRAEPAAAEGHPLPGAPGARRADARGNAEAGLGLVPRHRLAAGAAVPPPGPGRAFRVGLPDPVDARREIARRPQRHRGRLHRPACLVRGLPARRRLDRLRSDLGPAGRRRPHPARLHAAADQRRAGRGADRRMRGGVRARDGRHAHLRIAARDQALYRIAMGRRAGAGRGGRRATGGRRRAADPGRRAHLRLDRRSRRRRMEYRRARAHQARLRHLADPEAARRIRRGRLPAFRPGQVVPGRAVAALGVVGVLAQGRRAGLAGPGAVRRRARAVLLHHRGRAALHPRAGRAARFERRAYASRFRGRLVLPVARTPAAGQRRPVRLAPGRRTGARAAAQGVRPAARHGDRLRAAFEAAAAIARAGRPALGNRPVVLPRRAHVPDPRRFADGLSPAARFAALGQRHRLPLPDRPRSFRAGRAAADRRGAARALPRRHRRAALPGRAGRLRRPAHGRRARARRCSRRWMRGTRPAAAGSANLPARRPARAPPAPHTRPPRTATPIASNRPPGSRAPRCAPRSATACSTCSCRRWPRWRTISTCFPQSS